MDFLDVQNFIQVAEETLDRQKANLKDIENQVLDFFKENIIPSLREKKIIVQSRIKDSGSLREKIYRKNYHLESESGEEVVKKLPDLIGVRLSCMLNSEEEEVHKDLKKIFTEKITFREKEWFYIKGKSSFKILLKDKPDVQKNNHIIYKYECVWLEDELEYNVELQVKSLVHMMWGELEHMLIYKNYDYSMDSSLNTDIMNSTFNILLDVDKQLQLINKHIKVNKKDNIEQAKLVITKLFYEYTAENISDFLKVKIDLREVYNAVINSSLLNKHPLDSEKVIKLSSKMLDLGNIDYSVEFNEIESISEDSFNSTETDRTKSMNKVFVDLIKSGDVFWKIYWILLKYLNDVDASYSKYIDDFSKNIMDYISTDGYVDELVEVNLSQNNAIKDSVFNESVVDFIKIEKKVAILSNLSIFKENLKQFAISSTDSLYIYKEYESANKESEVKKLLKNYLLVYHYIENKINIPEYILNKIFNCDEQIKEDFTFDDLTNILENSRYDENCKNELFDLLKNYGIANREDDRE